ncbi:DUF3784 domain-containing protein [Peptoniphilaceae bacterium SGI.131]
MWLVLILSLVFLGMSLMSFMEKGPLLNNAYIWNSKEGRNLLNKKPYYRQSAISFLIAGLVFLSLFCRDYFTKPIFNKISFVLVAFLIIYAIYSSIAIATKKF